MPHNPWDVDFIGAFTFLKCPECIFDTKKTESILDHASRNHPNYKQNIQKMWWYRKNPVIKTEKKEEILEKEHNCDNLESEQLQLTKG